MTEGELPVLPDGCRTTVPMHKEKTMGRGLLRNILRDVGSSAEELLGHLPLGLSS